VKLDPRQQIAGHSAKAIRDLLKRQDYLTATHVQKTLGISPTEAAETIGGLLAAGYLEDDSRGFHLVAPPGRQIGNASFAKRMPRSKADLLLRDLLMRAAEINVRTELTHRVAQIDVFGSYLSEAEDLGDLDIAVRLELRVEYARNLVEASLERAEASGRKLTFLERLGYSEREVLEIIKCRRREISIHDFSDLELLNIPSQRVFP
jgi:predicted nucleotidyltransferase